MASFEERLERRLSKKGRHFSSYNCKVHVNLAEGFVKEGRISVFVHETVGATFSTDK